jgi:hypothetical protein
MEIENSVKRFNEVPFYLKLRFISEGRWNKGDIQLAGDYIYFFT